MKEVRLFIYLVVVGLVELFSALAKIVSALVLRVLVSVPVLVLLSGVALYKLLLSAGASTAIIALTFTVALVLWVSAVIAANPLPLNLPLKWRLAALKNKYETAK